MIVVDTSAVVDALLGRPRSAALGQRLGNAGSLHAPHLLDIEFVSVIRRLVLRGDLHEARATDALLDFERLRITRYPATPLLTEIWELRHRLSAYDAAFVVTARVLDCPLVTCDRALATLEDGTRVEVY